MDTNRINNNQETNNNQQYTGDTYIPKDSRPKKKKKSSEVEIINTDSSDFDELAKTMSKKPKISAEQDKIYSDRIRKNMTFCLPSEVAPQTMSPITALYIACRQNDFPKEFMDGLSSMQNIDRGKMLGVVQMLTQMKKKTMGEIDRDFLLTKESYSLLGEELILRVNGLADKPIQQVDATHLHRWIVSRHATKYAIKAISDTSIITVGDYCIQSLLDKKFVYDLKSEMKTDMVDRLRKATDKFNDWTQWTKDDCESLTVGLSSATASPITIVPVDKGFHYYCVSLLNMVSLKLEDDRIKIISLSQKLNSLSSFFLYNKKVRNTFDYTQASKAISAVLGTDQCYDKILFTFSTLAYVLTYARNREIGDFLAVHKEDYTTAMNSSFPSSLSFMGASNAKAKADAYKNLKNIETFYDIQANNRRYRDIIGIGTLEYDTTYYVGQFERGVRRACYLNQLFKGYCYIGLGSGYDPKLFKSDPQSVQKRFYNIGVAEGMSATQPFIDLIKEVTIPETSKNVVFYMPIVKHEGSTALYKKMIQAGFKSVRVWTPDQAHSPFFPIEFSRESADTFDFVNGYGKFDVDLGDTILAVIMFNAIKRVMAAEKNYMIKSQLGIGHMYQGKYVDVSEVPEEIVNITSSVDFEEVEMIDPSLEKDMKY